MNRLKLTLILFIASISFGFSQEECFPKKQNKVFVYDRANILSASEERELNGKLNAFTKETSDVLVVLTVKDLCGYDKSQFAIEYGDQIGIGRADKDNGIVLLVKPKYSNSSGQVFIAVGTGLQGSLTDASSGVIVRNELIPYFKQNDYYGGINNASTVIMKLARGEFSEENYMAEEEKNEVWGFLVLFLIIMVVIYLSQKYGDGGNDDWENYDRHGKHRGRRGGGIPWIFIGGGGGSGGGFSGGGGGFGGFGGGGFSGGGAGGSW